ncbi:hypothetical protein EJ05DRAFT_499619 [Pseudovirgaria hyperparasitica]|uniref:Uncharacterized protein n=1 Tax=Pseudovirgaria hyperparasitica TaxID=470096 RepID=A0A6A6WB56_9PEZI|nr:uncharacterized protein EJ05DRAFT_499619 [Pseudovirgaria hyperparasitica]KAF2759200.1 hypothetical protein EJ05DRAFT_499619 [Pseudovirgaria hyperparasitica]
MPSHSLLPAPKPTIRTLTTCLGLLSCTMGLRAIHNPAQWSLSFGFPATTSTAKTAAQNPYIPAVGARNIASGLGLILCGVWGLDRALGVMLLTGCVVGVVDGWTVRPEGWYGEGEGEVEGETLRGREERMGVMRGKVWMHWALIPVVAGAGVWML